MSYESDTISDSRLSWPSNHTIQFEVPSAIPAGGQIVIAFEGEPFLIDPSFSYSDVDLAISTTSRSSGFVERTLAPVPDSGDDGVAIAPITGPITITLSSGSGIPAGAYVQIELGTNAPDGVYQITNPSSTASYRILLNTYDASATSLDYGAAMVAILPGVGVDANTDKVNPAVISNGMPSGTIPGNAGTVLASFNTDTYATCRYTTVASTSYELMTSSTVDNALGTFHTFTVAGITQGTTYTFYVRCRDFAGNENPSDYIISFYAGNPTGTGSGGGAAGSGGGGGGGGGGAPFPAPPSSPSLTIAGIAPPDADIAILEDGTKISATTLADSSGNFSLNITSLVQGTHSFTIQAVNGATVESSYTATITVVAGTLNNIANVVLPPSISFATSTVALDATTTISGVSEPLSTIYIVVTSQAGLQVPFQATTTASGNGLWSYTLATQGFPQDTYQVKAQSSIPGFGESTFSTISFLGVGEEALPKFKIGDLNGDGKVNLVDFSILLTHWGTNYAADDLNGDGTVDLPDLSIMLFNWTG